jgi:hypothetical protein
MVRFGAPVLKLKKSHHAHSIVPALRKVREERGTRFRSTRFMGGFGNFKGWPPA